MTTVQVPQAVLAAEIRAGHVTIDRVLGHSTGGRMAGVVDMIVERGLTKGAEASAGGALLQWPEYCCNCSRKGPQVRPVESRSLVTKSVSYVFSFEVPHCPDCAKSANRKRPGWTGMIAAFLSVSILSGIAVALVGGIWELDALFAGSLLIGPLLGVLVPWAWSKMRRPRPGQASWHQAVYASDMEMDFTAVPRGFSLTFENPAYAARFVALNKSAGVSTS